MKNPIRRLIEDEMCIHLFQHPQDITLFDIELLQGVAFDWAERLEIGPRIAQLAGVYEYTDAISEHAPNRIKIMQYVAWLREEAEHRLPAKSFPHLLAALKQLEELERSAETKLPAWQRHMRRAGAA